MVIVDKRTEQQEGARLVQEWLVLKDLINESSVSLVRFEEEHTEKKRVFDTILADIEGQLAPQKAALDAAKQKVKEAEGKRKDAHTQLNATSKDFEGYDQIKGEYVVALADKKQTMEAKEQAQNAYDQALKPFEGRLSTSLKAKQEASDSLKEVKEELKKSEHQFLELSQRCFERKDAQDLFDQEMTTLVETSIDVRKKINLLIPVRDQAADILRNFVSENPTGWSTGAIDAIQRYLTWINRAQTYGVILEDNPNYWYELDDVLKLLGIAHIFKVLKVDTSKLESAAKAGELHGKDNEIVSSEQFLEIRQKKLSTPRLKAFALGELAVDEIMISMAQELYERDATALEELGESGKLSKQAVTALREAGITKASQLQRLSMHQLAGVRGIGEKRAMQIFRVIAKR
ncbi:hypothetical protein KKH07_00695 [Patescibacteria group bacterium]|nr:hypothetical protein [Patescibacteria group bacterium]MBU1563609.1 hypothetical protein [Patescibacteria group bacterium]MBU2068025.1 hypothetical protein [Patescibacteria group bacterium]